jgi:CDP-glycerol glycerophosphotransferase (TagB/SpsB family)
MRNLKNNILIKLFIYIINLPLYFISLLIPKNKNIWIFGAWFGKNCSDNTKYLFEYINKNCPYIKPIWLSKNSKTIKLIMANGGKAYNIYSFLGYLYSSMAKVCVVNQGIIDVNKFIPSPLIINLWHGIPLKKVMYDNDVNNKPNRFKKVKKIFFPFIRYPEDYDMMISCSENDRNNFASAFKIAKENIKITGYPRNDAIFINNNIQFVDKNKFNVIYMPTFRKRKNKDNFFASFEIDEISKKLEMLNSVLYLKIHLCDQSKIKNLDKYIKKLDCIKIIDDEEINNDIYSIINSFNILITDYSSIYFDFLLTDKPIIFFPFDYRYYIKYDRSLYYDYESVTPGPKCKNWDEIIEWIEKFKNNPSLYSEERKKTRYGFHKYQDGKSSERVYNEIKKLIEKV